MKIKKTATRIFLLIFVIISHQTRLNGEQIETIPILFEGSKMPSREPIKLQSESALIYENQRGAKGDIYFFSGEAGDQFYYDSELRFFKAIDFEYFAALNPFESNQTGIFRIYSNNQDAAESIESKSPKQILYESTKFALKPGYNMVSIRDLNVKVPKEVQSITWTVNFLGLSKIGKAGLILNSNPTVGSSEKSFWLNKGTTSKPNWQYSSPQSKLGNFSIRATIKPTPPVKLNASKTAYSQGEKILVNFTGSPKNKYDWLGIYPENIIPGSVGSLSWLYTNGTKNHGSKVANGTVSFNGNLPPGEYKIYFFEEDTYNHLGEFAFAIADTFSPEISLIGSEIITLNIGDTYLELGANAIDNNDGDISKSIKVEGYVNTDKAGIYTIIYKVKDYSGNAAEEISRIIEVINPAPPNLKIVRNHDNKLTLIFEGKLHKTANFNGTWEELDFKSPVVLSPEDASSFYRAIR